MISEDIFQIHLCMIDSYLDQSIHKTAVVSRESQWPSKVFDSQILTGFKRLFAQVRVINSFVFYPK